MKKINAADFDAAYQADKCQLRKKHNRALRAHRNYRTLSWIFGVSLGVIIALYVFALNGGSDYKSKYDDQVVATVQAEQKASDLDKKLTDANTATAAKVRELEDEREEKRTAIANVSRLTDQLNEVKAAKSTTDSEAKQAKDQLASAQKAKEDAEKAKQQADADKANALQQLAIANARTAPAPIIVQDVPRATSVPDAPAAQRIELVSTQPAVQRTGGWSMDKFLGDQVAKVDADISNPDNSKYADKIRKYKDALVALRSGTLTFNQSSLVKDMAQGKRRLGTDQERKGAEWLEQALASAKVYDSVAPN